MKKRLIWIVLLAAGLVVQLGLVVIPGIILPTGIALLVLFGIPGFVLARFILGHDDLSPVETLAFSLVLGLALLILAGTLLLVQQATLTTLIRVSLALNLVLVLLYLLFGRGRQDARSDPRDVPGENSGAVARAWSALWGADASERQFLVLSVVFLALVTALLTFFALEVRMWDKSDGWSYAAYLRRYIVEDTLSPYGTISTQSDARFALSTWVGVLAAVGRVAQVDPNLLYWAALVPALGAVTFLSFYALARTLFRSASTAILASTVQVLYYASSLFRDTGGRVWAGSGLMKRIQEDKYAAVWIVAPIALALGYRYLQKGQIRHLLGFLLVATAATIVHPMGYVSLLLAFGGFALVHAVAAIWPAGGSDPALSAPAVRRTSRLMSSLADNRATLLRFVLLLALLALLAVIPWLARQALVEGGSRAFAPQDPERLLDTYEQARHLVVFSPGWFMASPSLLWHPMILLGLAMTLFLIRHLRHSWPAQFLFAGMVGPLLLVYNPLTASLLAGLLTPSQIWRIRLSLPVGLVIGFVLSGLLSSLAQRTARSSTLRIVGTLRPFLGVGTVALLALLLRGSFQQGMAEIRAERTEAGRTVGALEQDVLVHLDAELATDAVVVADTRLSDYVPAFTSNAQLLFFRGKANRDLVDDAESVNDVVRAQLEAFYATATLDAEVVDWLDRYDVALLVVSKSTLLSRALTQVPSGFELRYENESYQLYRVAADLATNPAVRGELLLLEEDLAGAEQNLQQAALQSPDNILPYLGLAKIRLLEGRPDEAFEYFARAHALSPDPETAVDAFLWAINIVPESVLEYTRAGEMYQSPAGLNVVYRFLDHVDEEARLVPDDGSFVYRSAAVVDREPRGTMFQHPPSRAEFRLQIPANGSLEFAIALAPDVWSVGKGDGVQFDLEIGGEQGGATSLYSEYIDPKNVAAHRKWNDRSVDLSPWSGQVVTLTFTTGPGPNGNDQYDWAIWAEPRIVQPIAYDLIEQWPAAVVSGSGSAGVVTHTVGYQPHLALSQQAPSRVVYTLDLPLRSELRFDLPPAAAGRAAAVCVIYVRDSAAPSRLYSLYRRQVAPAGDLPDAHWSDERVDLAGFGGKTVEIIFDCAAAGDGMVPDEAVVWGTPMIVDTSPPDAPFDIQTPQ